MSNPIESIYTPLAPRPIGSYSQAIRHQGLLYVSGQLAIDTASGEYVSGSVEEEARRSLEHLSAILKAGGSSLERVLKVSIFLQRMSDFPKVNQVYSSYFSTHRPARETVEVGGLPLGAKIELSCIAAV